MNMMTHPRTFASAAPVGGAPAPAGAQEEFNSTMYQASCQLFEARTLVTATAWGITELVALIDPIAAQSQLLANQLREIANTIETMVSMVDDRLFQAEGCLQKAEVAKVQP